MPPYGYPQDPQTPSPGPPRALLVPHQHTCWLHPPHPGSPLPTGLRGPSTRDHPSVSPTPAPPQRTSPHGPLHRGPAHRPLPAARPHCVPGPPSGRAVFSPNSARGGRVPESSSGGRVHVPVGVWTGGCTGGRARGRVLTVEQVLVCGRRGSQAKRGQPCPLRQLLAGLPSEKGTAPSVQSDSQGGPRQGCAGPRVRSHDCFSPGCPATRTGTSWPRMDSPSVAAPECRKKPNG